MGIEAKEAVLFSCLPAAVSICKASPPVVSENFSDGEPGPLVMRSAGVFDQAGGILGAPPTERMGAGSDETARTLSSLNMDRARRRTTEPNHTGGELTTAKPRAVRS